MSTTINSEIIRATEDKSLLRIINLSSPENPAECDDKNSIGLEDDSERKNCTNSSKIPRPPMTASYSFNETPKSNQSKGKTKKPPSMIPRSKSRKRTENEKVKFDMPSKTDYLKNQLNNASTSYNKKSNTNVGIEESTSSSHEMHIQSNLGPKLLKITSSLKFCQDFVEVMKNMSDIYKDSKEDFMKMEEENDETRSLFKNVRDWENVPNKNNGIKDEMIIRSLYETIKSTIGPAFDSFKLNRSDSENSRFYSNAGDLSECEAIPDFSSIQEHYEFTLKEISNIWKNTVGLIGSVKDHIIQFVEDNSTFVDREQLVLESEMLQLSLDLAINYSKLKMDSLIKLAKERLNVKKFKRSELENFMDSKTFSFDYSNDDLAAMARTLRDLNDSLLKGEDVELE